MSRRDWKVHPPRGRLSITLLHDYLARFRRCSHGTVGLRHLPRPLTHHRWASLAPNRTAPARLSPGYRHRDGYGVTRRYPDLNWRGGGVVQFRWRGKGWSGTGVLRKGASPGQSPKSRNAEALPPRQRSDRTVIHGDAALFRSVASDEYRAGGPRRHGGAAIGGEAPPRLRRPSADSLGA